MKHVFVFILLAVFSAPLQAREVVTLTWPTSLASPPADFPKPVSDWLPMFRMAIATLPEATTIGLALSQPSFLDLPPAAAAKLGPLVARRYEMIAADKAYAQAVSALPYCFFPVRPAQGQASLYVPDHPSASSGFMVFLHGYGGSFLWYQHYLSELFPDDVILAPAYGVSAADIPAEYVAEAMRAAERRLGCVLPKPRLIGLSAGGFGACRVYANRPGAFASLLVLAAYPPADALLRFQKDQRLSFLAGQKEVFVTEGRWEGTRRQIMARGIPVSFVTIPEADHFFMLTHPEATAAWLRGK